MLGDSKQRYPCAGIGNEFVENNDIQSVKAQLPLKMAAFQY